MNKNFMNWRMKCLNEIISCTSLPLCKVLYWVSMIQVMNCLGHLNKRSLLMSGSLLSLHSLFQQLWWDYCSWEASLNSCTPVHLHFTSLIFHNLKLFLLKYCLWSKPNIFFSSLNYRFWFPLLVLFQREKKTSHKITLKGQENLKKRDHIDSNAKWEQCSGFTPLLPNTGFSQSQDCLHETPPEQHLAYYIETIILRPTRTGD